MTNSARVKFGSIDRHKALRVSVAGRVCGLEGCSTVLSIYNDSSQCSVHERLLTTLRGKKR